MMFEKVAIVGVGLLGGSLALDLKAHRLARTVVGVCRSEFSANQALNKEVVDEVAELRQAVAGAELVVLATPMLEMIAVLQNCHDVLDADCIVTDVGSVKTQLDAQLTAQVPHLRQRFVLAHPIAGGERSGVNAAKEGLFRGKHVILTENELIDPVKVGIVEQMWSRVGAHVIRMGLEEHDAVFAKTSHLPHVVAFSLVNYLQDQPNREQLFDLAAAGFYDFTRIASSNAEMWRDICITNQGQVLAALDGYIDQLSLVRENIANADRQGILEYFGSAKSARDLGLSKKNR